jgi:hypothetical protein
LVSKDGDYVEKDQAVAEVDSDNNTRIASWGVGVYYIKRQKKVMQLQWEQWFV